MYPNRIDFLQLSGKVVITKFERRNERDYPTDHHVTEGFDLPAAVQWCEDNGYTVRKWHRGARAWLGKPWVIRTRRQTIKARQRFAGEGKVHMDFAYDG